MTQELKVLAEEIAKLTPGVVAAAKSRQEAWEATRAAEAKVVQAVLTIVGPALPALGSRIEKHWYETAGRNGCHPVSREEWFEERGLLLDDDWADEPDETGNRGGFGGARLYLLSDGRLAVVRREGTWSRWQGEADEWTAELIVVAPRKVVEDYDLVESVLRPLRNALAEQARGNSGRRAEELAREIAKLEAILQLCGG